MEGYSRSEEFQLLDLISKDKETRHIVSEEKKLELRLGPPGDQDWTTKTNSIEKCQSLLSLGYFSEMTDTGGQPQKVEKKPFSVPASEYTAVVPNTSQKRAAPAPVVGWPPIRSFRKNLVTSSSSKSLTESQKDVHNKVPNEKEVERCKGLFVKINMDGVPIGRKVDLKTHDSYEKLSSSIDELFRDLLAAQMDSCDGMQTNERAKDKEITGLLDGTGEYTLVYEDNEGDRMLVGDVPWHMFVSSVKRLRVLKSSELSALFCRGTGKDQREAPPK